MSSRDSSAQSPPDPNFQRQQIFSSYQEFKNQLTAAAGNATQLDAFWTQLKNAGQIPYAQGGQMAFLYRGAATSVSFPGDFSGWDPNQSSAKATQLAGSNVWLLEKTFPTDARLDYKVVTGGSNWILDPDNRLQMWSGFGPNSELRMPDYAYPQQTVRQAGGPRGELSANIKTTSTRLGYDVNYRVYTPAGYAQQQLANLPVVYVTDGHEYSADHMGSTVVVLDNLIAAGAIQPTMAVFIDPRDPANPNNNRRMSEYVQNANFAGFVADELVPRIDAAYRSLASPTGRTILGTSLGGINSAYFGATRPDVFENIAIQSPATFSQSLVNLYNTQPLQNKLDIFMTAGTIGDGNMGPTFAAVLNARGYDYKFVQVNEGHSWGNWRALLDDIFIDLLGPTPTLAADFNEDGAVDAADLDLLKSAQGKTTGATHRNGDADADRDVDGADFLIWQRQLNPAAPAAPHSQRTTTGVPEPTGCSMGKLLLAALTIAARQKPAIARVAHPHPSLPRAGSVSARRNTTIAERLR